MTPGIHTGRWVYREVRGKYKRIEFYKVGNMVTPHQYEVHSEHSSWTHRHRWGYLAVEWALAPDNPEHREYMRQQKVFLKACDECFDFPRADVYLGKYICKCGVEKSVMGGRWHLCAECNRRFKSKTHDFMCPECRS
jgi:hypothetical protein